MSAKHDLDETLRSMYRQRDSRVRKLPHVKRKAKGLYPRRKRRGKGRHRQHGGTDAA